MKAIILALLGVSSLLNAAESKPNIIFVLFDDMGYGQPQSYNAGSALGTPNLDRLAREGTDFQQFNVASPVCSPSRAGFMCGVFPEHPSV